MAPSTQDVLVIAEAGVNHNGSLDRALAMVRAAAEAGADYVKFQAFDTDQLVAAGASTARYQQSNTGELDQKSLLRPLEISLEQFSDIAAECRQAGIGFMCTPFNSEMTAALVDMGMDRIKIASGEMVNHTALRHFASFGLPVILSTGMATLDEVRASVAVLRDAGAEDISVLHCTSLYPAPEDTLNLRAIKTLSDAFGLPTGYSDHSLGINASVAAVALGATVIEKHFTLDKSLPGPDHVASLDAEELRGLIAALRSMTVMLGSGEKAPCAAELDTAKIARRSWHAARDLAPGTVLAEGDVILKRPAHGLGSDRSPLGKTLTRGVTADAPIHASDLDG